MPLPALALMEADAAERATDALAVSLECCATLAGAIDGEAVAGTDMAAAAIVAAAAPRMALTIGAGRIDDAMVSANFSL